LERQIFLKKYSTCTTCIYTTENMNLEKKNAILHPLLRRRMGPPLAGRARLCPRAVADATDRARGGRRSRDRGTVADRATAGWATSTGWATSAVWASTPAREPGRLLSALAHATDGAGVAPDARTEQGGGGHRGWGHLRRKTLVEGAAGRRCCAGEWRGAAATYC
jgi:hypothetical protein